MSWRFASCFCQRKYANSVEQNKRVLIKFMATLNFWTFGGVWHCATVWIKCLELNSLGHFAYLALMEQMIEAPAAEIFFFFSFLAKAKHACFLSKQKHPATLKVHESSQVWTLFDPISQTAQMNLSCWEMWCYS